MKKILIIEDEQDMVTGLKFNLEARDYLVIDASDGEKGIIKAIEQKPDLVILDIMLPGINGYDVCKKLKKINPELPIIMLTAKSQEAEIVTGLELGADDYITKPFGVMELLARIKAVLRRTDKVENSREVYEIGDLQINFKTQLSLKNGRKLNLSTREYEILELFISNRGEVVSRKELLNQIWGYDSIPDTRTVDAHIAKLRKKIEDNPEEPKIIVTLHGIGYKLL